MTPLKIALLSPFPPLKGGIARFSSLLAGALAEAGHEVFPVSFRTLYPRWLLGGRSPVEPGTAEGAALASSGLDLVNPLTWFTTARRIRAMKPDVLLIAYWSAILAPLCYVVRRVSGVTTVILLHNFTTHEHFPAEGVMKRLLLLSAEGFIALSASVHGELKRFRPSVRSVQLFHPVYEPALQPPGREDARLQLGIASEAKLLLFFGYVRGYKGLDMLFEAMAIAVRLDPAIRLMVAGEFIEGEGRFRALAARLGISGSVDIFPGYVPERETSQLFSAADAVVLPYRSASQSGVARLALGFGVPVIVTAAGGLAEEVEHRGTGWVVEASSPEAFAEGMVAFFRERDPAHMQRRIAASREAASWRVFAGEAGRFLGTVEGTG